LHGHARLHSRLLPTEQCHVPGKLPLRNGLRAGPPCYTHGGLPRWYQ
jgi:hypothetical protein